MSGTVTQAGTAMVGIVVFEGKRLWGWIGSAVVHFCVAGGLWIWFAKFFTAELVARGWSETAVTVGVWLVCFTWITRRIGWSAWIGPRLVRRIVSDGELVRVERLVGYWEGPVQALALRRPQWLVPFVVPYFRLELADGRCVGEIIANWKKIEADVERLKAWLSEHGARQVVDEPEWKVRGERLRRSVAQVAERWQAFGRVLFYIWLATSLAGIGAAALLWPNLPEVSLYAIFALLVEVPVVVSLAGAYRAGFSVERGLASVFWFAFVAFGAFALPCLLLLRERVSVSGPAAVTFGLVCVCIVVLEWARAGSVFRARNS